jgi:hypothetical protein
MQSKPKGLKSEVDPAIAKKAFDLIRTATKTFDRWMGKDIARLLDYVKIVNFQK